MELDRIKTVTEWPMPTSYCNIQVFLGFVNFYRQFNENVFIITKPMSGMLKGQKNGQFLGPFWVTPKMEHAFCRL